MERTVHSWRMSLLMALAFIAILVVAIAITGAANGRATEPAGAALEETQQTPIGLMSGDVRQMIGVA